MLQLFNLEQEVVTTRTFRDNFYFFEPALNNLTFDGTEKSDLLAHQFVGLGSVPHFCNWNFKRSSFKQVYFLGVVPSITLEVRQLPALFVVAIII